MTPEVNQDFINEYAPLTTDNICHSHNIDPQDQKARAILAWNLSNPDDQIDAKSQDEILTLPGKDSELSANEQVHKDLIQYFDKIGVSDFNKGMEDLLSKYTDDVITENSHIEGNYIEGKAWTALQLLNGESKRLYYSELISYIYDSNVSAMKQDPAISGTIVKIINEVLDLYSNPIDDLLLYNHLYFGKGPEGIVSLKLLRHGIDVRNYSNIETILQCIKDTKKYLENVKSIENYISVSPIVSKGLPLLISVHGDDYGCREVSRIATYNTGSDGDIVKFSIDVSYVGGWYALSRTVENLVERIINNVNSSYESPLENWRGMDIRIGMTNRVLVEDVHWYNEDDTSEHERYCTFRVAGDIDPAKLITEVISRMKSTFK